MKLRFSGRHAVIGAPYLWLLLFFLLPFVIVLRISVSEMDGVQFSDLLSFGDGMLKLTLKLSNYVFLTEDALYLRTYAASLKYAAATTLLCLAIGYPFAYFMARARSTLQPALLMLVMLPFWTSFLLRVYAWRGLLTIIHHQFDHRIPSQQSAFVMRAFSVVEPLEANASSAKFGKESSSSGFQVFEIEFSAKAESESPAFLIFFESPNSRLLNIDQSKTPATLVQPRHCLMFYYRAHNYVRSYNLDFLKY